jgi:predicted nucleic acid-binding protein
VITLDISAVLALLDRDDATRLCGEQWAPFGAPAPLLGFSDAAVIACAERSGGTIATLDRRDFDVVAPEASITLVP